MFCVNPGEGSLINVTNVPGPFGGPTTRTPLVSANGAVVTFWSTADLAPGLNSDLSPEVFVALLKPSLSVDAAPASTRSLGDTFIFTGFGFTPDGPVTRRVRQPNGTEVILGPPMTADLSGRISWTFESTAGTPTGTYQLWVIDDNTGRISNTVYETVLP